ncbi:MAG: hypothetical protein EXS03_05215 [Phycisphaerales bacterium]|nr:hypothetical protein [Phycisphaerales bacterium]
MPDGIRASVRGLLALSVAVLASCAVPPRGSEPSSPPPQLSALIVEPPPALPPEAHTTVRHNPQPFPKIEPSAKADIPLADIARAIELAHDLGVAWALANQRADGNWGTFATERSYEIYLDTQASHRAFQTATTALVTWGMMDPARMDDRCRRARNRGLEVLASRATPGRASGKTFYDVWAHTYIIELAVAVLSDQSLGSLHERWRGILQTELVRVRREQGTEGGWGYYDFDFTGLHPSGQQSTSFNTAAMIVALRRGTAAGATVTPGTVEDATRAVLRLQLPSGAFAYGTYAELTPRADYNKVSGSSGRLQACNLALFEVGAGGVTHETLLRGVEHLRDTHHYIEIGRGRVRPHEAFYRNSGYYYYFGHFYAARVLAACPPSPERMELARWLAEVMIHDQNPDGSWFDYPLYGYGKAYATGYGLLTLQTLRPLLRESASP